MSSNKLFTEFIDQITAPSNHKKPEIFKLSFIAEYIRYWSENDQPQICSICQIAIETNGTTKQSAIKALLCKTSEFAQTMPENMVGVVLTWLFIQYEGSEIFSFNELLSIDPVSILFHMIVGCCDAAMGTETAHLDICNVFKSPLFSVVETKHVKKPGSKSLNQGQELRLLLECLRAYVDGLQFKKKSNQFLCNKCVYSDDGEVEEPSDCRIYVSNKWVSNKLHIDYAKFIEEETYETYMPGIYVYENRYGKSKINTEEAEADIGDEATTTGLTHCNRGSGRSIGFLAAEMRGNCGENQNTNKYAQEHKVKTDNLFSRISYIMTIIKAVPSNFQNKNSPVYIVSMHFPMCMWCAFCVDKRMRIIINDLFVMCERKVNDSGLINNFAVKITPPSNVHNRDCPRDTPCGKPKLCKSFGFYKSTVPFYVLNSVFKEWLNLKYPFLKLILDNNDYTGHVNSLLNHQDPNKSICCTGNIRRTFVESDLHLQSKTYRCFIIHAIRILQILLDGKVKLSKEKAMIRKIAFEHSIPLSPMLK